MSEERRGRGGTELGSRHVNPARMAENIFAMLRETGTKVLPMKSGLVAETGITKLIENQPNIAISAMATLDRRP